MPLQIRLSNCLRIADSLCTASGSRRTILTFSVCRKTSIVIKKWGLGRSPKRGEGGSPTLSPFPRGRGLGLGIENSHYLIKTYFFYKQTAPPYFLRRSGFMYPVLTMPIKTDKPPSERRGQRCLYDMLCKLLQQCDLADKGKLLSLSLCGINDTHNHKYKSEDTAYCA